MKVNPSELGVLVSYFDISMSGAVSTSAFMSSFMKMRISIDDFKGQSNEKDLLKVYHSELKAAYEKRIARLSDKDGAWKQGGKLEAFTSKNRKPYPRNAAHKLRRRINIALKTGKLDLVKKGPFGGFFDFTGKIATPFVESEAPTVPSFGKKSYVDLSAEKKLESIQALLRSIGNTGDINKARLLYEQEIKKGSLFGKKLNPQELQQANDVIKYLQMFGDDPLGEIDPKKKDLFLKELSSVNINPKELSKKISSLDNINNTSGVSQGGNAGNVAVLPMGNNSNQSLVRNDTGGLTSGPTMKIHPNFDADNFVAPINMANFNVV